MEIEKNFEEVSDILRFTMGQVDPSQIANKTDLQKLNAIIDSESRNPQSQFIREVVGKPPMLFGKGKWENNIRNSDILFGSVVQCHPQLWQKVTEDISPAAYLMVYSLNPKYSRDVETLKKVSLLLNEFRDMDLSESTHQYSTQMKDLHEELDDPNSTPHVVLDSTLLSQIGITDEDADIRITSMYAYAHTQFPNNRLPSDGILPFIRYREPNLSVDVNFSYATKLIPAKYYM